MTPLPDPISQTTTPATFRAKVISSLQLGVKSVLLGVKEKTLSCTGGIHAFVDTGRKGAERIFAQNFLLSIYLISRNPLCVRQHLTGKKHD